MDVTALDNTAQFQVPEAPQIIIKAIGVGGGGNNAVDHMCRAGIQNVSFVNINTDKQALRKSVVPERLVIGDGLGAGAIPDVARQAAENAAEEIAQLFDDETRMVFITAGMGGGTGTGAAPVVARIAKEHHMLTIGIVTIPFLFEGPKKIMKAIEGAEEMSKYVDALLVINNERLTEIYHDLDLVNGFAKADDTLTVAARSISELITCEGHINLDFNDVNTTLRDGGAAIISTGYGEGEKRVTEAINNALESPLLKNRNIEGSKKLLFNIYYSRKAENPFKMEEANELTQFVQSIDSDVDVIWGLAYDDSLDDRVKITILASGFDVSLKAEEESISKSKGRFNFSTKKDAKSAPKAETIVPELEYGDKFLQASSKDRQRYIILQPDQFDDEAVIDIFEKTPTLTRDKKIVSDVGSLAGTMQKPDHTATEPSPRKPSQPIQFG